MTEKEHSHTAGVKPMTIIGRMETERERLLGMSAEERAWRAQWLKDQILAPDEPRFVPEYYQQRYNAFRRFYRAPLDKIEFGLLPKVGPEWAYFCRHVISKSFFGLLGIWGIIYYFKYNPSDWMRTSGWKVGQSRAKVFPGDPNWPNFETKTDRQYATYGFEKSPI